MLGCMKRGPQTPLAPPASSSIRSQGPLYSLPRGLVWPSCGTARWASWATALMAVLLASCGGDDAGSSNEAPPPPFRRVFQPSSMEDPAATLQVLHTLSASDEPAPWTATAEDGVKTIELSRNGQTVQAVQLLGLGKLKYLRGPVPASAAGFNQVTVEVSASPVRPLRSEQARLYLYRDGEKLMDPLSLELQQHDDLQVATFSSPLLRGTSLTPDEFAVAFVGRVRSAAVVAVTFSRADETIFAPPIAVESAADMPLVRIGDVSRRSLGVMPQHPYSASFQLLEGEEFRAYLGPDSSALRPGEIVEMTVSVKGPSHKDTKTISAGDGAEWEELVVKALDYGTGAVELTVSIDSNLEDGSAIGVVAEPTIRRASTATAATTGRTPVAPTVLLVTSDTHRADHIGIANRRGLVSTPHIDALAARGVHFADCVAPTNVTAPSHVSLMTGMHVRDTGILTNRDALAARAVTIASRFRAAGYETLAATSVFHLSQDRSGIGHGFDRINAPTAGMRVGSVAIKTMEGWIREAGDVPLFCWVHVYDAHTPYSPPEPYDGKYWDGDDPFEGPPAELGEVKLPGWLRGLSNTDYPLAQYRAEVDFVDGMLGSLFDLPRVRDGITAFTADHGELFGEHGVWWSHSGLYPGIQRIPLVMSWPGAPAGTKVDSPVLLMDVGATLARVAGIDAAELPGRDLQELIASPPAPEPRFFLGAHHHIAAIEADGWFLNLTLAGHQNASMAARRVPGAVELYHLTTDPDYSTNVVLQELERARALRARLIQWLENAPEERLNGQSSSGDAAADVAMLAALGYGGEQSIAGAMYWDPETYDSNWETSPWRIIFESEDMTRDRAATLLKQ